MSEWNEEAKQQLKELIMLWREILEQQPELKEKIQKDIAERDNANLT
jgi:predicted RNase H-like HicB family nuclease